MFAIAEATRRRAEASFLNLNGIALERVVAEVRRGWARVVGRDVVQVRVAIDIGEPAVWTLAKRRGIRKTRPWQNREFALCRQLDAQRDDAKRNRPVA